MTKNRPIVTLNVAVTADGKTDTVARRGATISSPHDLARVDRLRAESDAVLVGGRTLLGDDPRLTVKSADLRAQRRARGLEENPTKVGIVSNADLRLDSRFLTTGPAQLPPSFSAVRMRPLWPMALACSVKRRSIYNSAALKL